MAGSYQFPLSESMQMYLVTIARSRENDHPVPLSQLARELAVSPVSVNEMCYKLQEQGLVIYQPYKGVTLTPEGDRRACYVLRRHRLWEVFLVEKLGLEYEEAHNAACQLEHTTSDLVTARLDAFLDYPSANPVGLPIPGPDGTCPARIVLPLASLSAGDSGRVVRIVVSNAEENFLHEQGVRPGALVTVLATTEQNLLMEVGETRISLVHSLAEAIEVEPRKMGAKIQQTKSPKVISKGEKSETKERSEMKTRTESQVNQVPLHELGVGKRGIVVRVGGRGPAKRRMLDMGLVPGSEVKVVRVAPLGDPVEFEVKGYSLSLRKSEASDIIVEVSAEGAK